MYVLIIYFIKLYFRLNLFWIKFSIGKKLLYCIYKKVDCNMYVIIRVNFMYFNYIIVDKFLLFCYFYIVI